MRTNAKVDANQKEIVNVLRKMGAVVIITSQLKNAFDILVGYRGVLYAMEIKDGSLPPSRQKLTEGEEKCKKAFEKAGCDYHVVNSVDQAINIIVRR